MTGKAEIQTIRLPYYSTNFKPGYGAVKVVTTGRDSKPRLIVLYSINGRKNSEKIFREGAQIQTISLPYYSTITTECATEKDLWSKEKQVTKCPSDLSEAAVFTTGPVQSAIWRYGVTSFTKVKSNHRIFFWTVGEKQPTRTGQSRSLAQTHHVIHQDDAADLQHQPLPVLPERR